MLLLFSCKPLIVEDHNLVLFLSVIQQSANILRMINHSSKKGGRIIKSSVYVKMRVLRNSFFWLWLSMLLHNRWFSWVFGEKKTEFLFWKFWTPLIEKISGTWTNQSDHRPDSMNPFCLCQNLTSTTWPKPCLVAFW